MSQTARGHPSSVRAAAVVGHASVRLGPEGVGDEVVAGAVVERRVDHQGDGIVAKQLRVALRELGGDRLGIPRAKRDVQVTGVVQHQRFGADIGPFAAPWLVLDEVRHVVAPAHSWSPTSPSMIGSAVTRTAFTSNDADNELPVVCAPAAPLRNKVLMAIPMAKARRASKRITNATHTAV